MLGKPEDGTIFRSSCPREPRPAESGGARDARIEGHRYPIARSCLTPGKRDMVVAGDEWLDTAGTMHKPRQR